VSDLERLARSAAMAGCRLVIHAELRQRPPEEGVWYVVRLEPAEVFGGRHVKGEARRSIEASARDCLVTLGIHTRGRRRCPTSQT
jgi:hypothetical protein